MKWDHMTRAQLLDELKTLSQEHPKKDVFDWVAAFPLSILIIHSDGHLVLANRMFEQEFGYSPEEIPTGDIWFQKAYPDATYREEVAKSWQQTMEQMERGEVTRRFFIVRTADGQDLNVKFLAFKWQAEHYCLVMEDVSLHNRIMRELQASQKKYSLLFHKSQDAVIIHDERGQILDVNEKALNLFGYSYGRLLQLKVADVLGPEFQSNLDFALKSTGDNLHLFTELNLRKQNGDAFSAEISASLFRIFEMTYFQVVVRDMTPRRQAEGRAELLTTAMFHAAESIEITDVQGRIEYVNPAYEKITGYTLAEIMGQSPSILKSGKHDVDFYREMWATLKRGEVWSGHFVNRKKDGSLFEEEGTISPVRDRQGNVTHYVAVKRDVTEQREMERQLRQSQKMEAIGTLAGGIAHDFNNILTAILGYTELALISQDNPDRLDEYLHEILTGSNRARELVKQILTFSRQQEYEPAPLVLCSVVKEVMKFIDSIIPKKIQVVVEIRDTNGMILGNSTQIHQILMNLCSNASHAMREEGGILEVIVAKYTITHKDVLSHSLPVGDYILLTVKDQGHGIPPDIIEKVFDPYFTTKKRDEGTGLGLSVVHGIVKEHHGLIRVDSEVGKGSRFDLFFPRLQEEKDPGEKARTELPRGTERILFVDDESMVVRLAQSLLEEMGYQVKVERNSRQALEHFRQGPDDFDLLIADKNMPEMDGLSLILEIHRIRPHLPVILCSGDIKALADTDLKEFSISAICPKPFQMQSIGILIRKVLDNKKAKQ